MRGHVRKRGATWSYVYDAGRDESGRRKQSWRSGFPTKKAAEDALAATLTDIQRQEHVDQTRLTFGRFVDELWWPHVAATRRPSTVEMYDRALRKHIRPLLGHLPLQKIAATDVDRLYREAATKGLAPSSARVLGAIVSAALTYAKRKRLLVRNVAEDADPPKLQRVPRTIWTARELASFLESVRDDRLFALWRLLALTGCRRGEALGLRWLDLDLEQGTITIAQQVVPLSGRLVFAAPKTNAGRRTIPIDAQTLEALRGHRETQMLERAVLGAPAEDLDLVFANADGQPLDPRGISQAFQVRRKRVELPNGAGLPHIRLHDLRHGAATLAIEGDVNLELIRRRLGHANIGTTIDVYARHDVETAERAAANTVAALLDG